VIAAVGASVAAGLLLTRDDEPHVPVHEMVTAAVSRDDLVAAGRARVFFDHQSVGMNVLDGVPDVYAEYGLAPPRVQLFSERPGGAETVAQQGGDGFLAHAFFGQNGDPLAKIADFDATVRGGVGDEVDVALMKLCYVDVTSETDVDEVFERYRSTLAALERDYPHVAFLHATTPLTTDPGWGSRVKKLLGRDPHLGPPDNEARERLNELIRREYRGDRLLDLAAIESTAPDGSRSAGETSGRRYYSLYRGYAADPGHLNEAGAAIAAAHLLHLVADAGGGRS
jgi:hypothetical protein